MLRLPTNKKKVNKLLGSKKSLYFIRNENSVAVYAAFIIKPHKLIDSNNQNQQNRFSYPKPKEEKREPLLTLLNQAKLINVSLHRMFIPGNVSKKNKTDNSKEKNQNKTSLLEELFEEKNDKLDVTLSFYIIKAWKKYDLLETFYSEQDIIEDFRFILRTELKQKLESVGKIGRLLGETLEELVIYSTLNHNNFLSSNNKIFSNFTGEYAVIEKNEEFLNSFKTGPSVDLRPETIFSFPTGIASDDNLQIGLSENDTPTGFPSECSYPILVSGDKKTREIIACKLLEQNNKFILLDPRSNLEFKDRLSSTFEYLTLGENFTFNVLTPVTEKVYMTEKLSSQYLGNFIDIVRAVTDVRSDAAVLLRDLIDFYVNEYQEEQEEILFPRHDTPVSLDDLYTMLTVDPGGLIITDFQLSTVRALINDIRDGSISETTKVNETRGLEQLFETSKIIDFSVQGYKIQKLFLYAFLLQLTVIDQIIDFEEDVLIFIDDAELFFSREIERTILRHILKKLENSAFKLVFSTPFPSQLAQSVFDLTHNRIIGNLKSAKCLRLVADSHGLDKAQQEFIRRFPKNNFFLVREDLLEKPILLRFFPEDIERHETQQISRKTNGLTKALEAKPNSDSISLNLEEFSRLYPIMVEILEKLSAKVNRGINTESLVNLFPNWEGKDVKETVSLLELYGYIFLETVDKRGKKGEYWTKITPRGKKFLDKLRYKELIKEKNREKEDTLSSEENQDEDLSSFIESPSIDVSQANSEELDNTIISLQKIRKKVKEIRDSKNITQIKLEKLSTSLKKIEPLLEEKNSEEVEKLEIFQKSLENLLIEEKSINDLPERIRTRIFQKALSLIDAIQIRATHGENSSSTNDEEFIEKIIEKEFATDKWKDFEREVFLTEIPELSKLKKSNTKITDFLNSELPENVLEGLELSTELPRVEFIASAKKAISSLLKIKTMFYPNMNIDDYLEEINSFFKSTGIPEPFEKSLQLLWEYSMLEESRSNKASEQLKKKKKEIIESIQEESDSYVFDFKDKKKDSIINQLILKIRKRINND